MEYLLLRAEKPHGSLPVFVTALSHDSGFYGNSGVNPFAVSDREAGGDGGDR